MTTPRTTTPRRAERAKVAITVGPGVTVLVPPADDGARMDSADDPGEYRRDVDTHRARRHKPGCPAAARRRDRAAAPPPSRPSAARPAGAPPKPAAPYRPTHRTATAPTSPVARVAPNTRLDRSGLTPAQRHRARQLAASDRRPDAIERAIATVRASGERLDAGGELALVRDELGQWSFSSADASSAPPRVRDPQARIDREQAGGSAAAAARKAMIDRTIASSRPRGAS